MSDTIVFKDAKGNHTPVDLTVSMYREAAERGQSLKQYMANVYPTNDDKFGSAYEQVLEQCGIYVRGDATLGLRPASVGDVLSNKSAGAITKDGVPASRLMFPAVMLDLVEDKLTRDYSTNPNALSTLVGIDETLQSDRWERPVLNYSKAEKARSAPVAQLAMPNSMLSLTVSDKAGRIPSWGIGLEISEQAQKAWSLDLVGLTVARQAAVEANERAQGHILNLLQGDTDLDMPALAGINGKVRKAVSFDPSITAAGKLTYKAWISWLTANANYRTLSHVVTNLDGLFALRAMFAEEAIAAGKKSEPKGMDTGVTIANPNWPGEITLVLTNDSNWTNGTFMAIDKRYGVQRVRSLSAQYSAIEEFAMQRKTMLRFDSGEVVYRFSDEAFEVLSLTL